MTGNMFKYLRNFQTFQTDGTFLQSHQHSMRVLVPLHPYQCLVNQSHSNVCVVVFPCGINLHHPKVNDFEHVLIYYLYIFSGVCSDLLSILNQVIIEF